MGNTVSRKKEQKRESNEGLVMGIKWELVEKGEEIEVNSEGIIIGKVRANKEKWKIIGVYVNRDIEEKLQRVGEWMEGKEKRRLTLIGGHFKRMLE